MRRRPTSTPCGGGDSTYDIFVATRPDRFAPFGTATLLPGVNTVNVNDEYGVVASDGLKTRADARYIVVAQGHDVYVATRATTAASFNAPTLLADVSATGASDYPTWISPGGTTLYLESNRSGAFAIYKSEKVGGAFQAPTPVTELNTNVGSGDLNAVLSPDELTVYFTSQRAGAGTTGGYDIWMGRRATKADPFTALTPLTSVNSTADDFPVTASPDGCRLYFISGRPGAGGRDVWVAER